MRNRVVFCALLAAAATILAAPAQAASFGIRGGLYTERDEPFVGIELLSHVSGRIYFNPNLEYVFVDSGSFGTMNFDAHIDLTRSSRTFIWIGAGLALAYTDPEGTAEGDLDAYANLISGIGFRTGGATPYVQLKIITSDPNEFVVAAGVRF